MTTAIDRYNYRRFTLDEVPPPDLFAGPRVSDIAPDFEAHTIEGCPVRLSEFAGQIVVLETGSMTCPLYTDKVAQMNALGTEFPEATFLLLYTHEAHPGERLGPHTCIEDKLAAARENRRVNNENREILVDDLKGTAHRLYGGFPNMLYLIDADGKVRMRGHWSDPRALREALQRLRDERSLAGLQFRFRYPGPFRALRTLLRGGWKAVLDGVLAMPRFVGWHRQERIHGWG